MVSHLYDIMLEEVADCHEFFVENMAAFISKPSHENEVKNVIQKLLASHCLYEF